jgi:hypothetical protein
MGIRQGIRGKSQLLLPVGQPLLRKKGRDYRFLGRESNYDNFSSPSED